MPKQCPRCGFSRRPGRPQKLDDGLVYRMRKRAPKKWSLARLAEYFHVSRSAIHASLARTLHSERKAFNERCKKKRPT